MFIKRDIFVIPFFRRWLYVLNHLTLNVILGKWRLINSLGWNCMVVPLGYNLWSEISLVFLQVLTFLGHQISFFCLAHFGIKFFYFPPILVIHKLLTVLIYLYTKISCVNRFLPRRSFEGWPSLFNTLLIARYLFFNHIINFCLGSDDICNDI